MKKVLMLICWAISAVTIIYAIAHPEDGVILQGPWYALNLGLIGLGLCRFADQRKARPAPERRSL